MSVDAIGASATAPRPPGPEIRERPAWTLPGRLALSVAVALAVVGIGLLSSGVSGSETALTAVGASLLVAFHSLFDFSLQMPAVALLFAIILGIGVGQARTTREAAN